MCVILSNTSPAVRVFIGLCFTIYLLGRTQANNLDTEYPTVFGGNAGSYFGYTVALLNSGNTKLALVSAIKDNSSYMAGVVRPGVLHKCKPESKLCTEVLVDSRGNGGRGGSGAKAYVDLKDDMQLGMGLKVQDRDGGKIVVCAPKWRNQVSRNIFGTNGLCYVLSNDMQHREELRPLLLKSQQTKQTINPVTGIPGNITHYAVGEAGFSVTYTSDDELILGAPGLLDWTGNLVKYVEGTDSLAGFVAQDGLVSQRQSQYIGYSVTSGRFTEALGKSIVAGAPRDTRDCRGAVYILGQTSKESKSFVLEVQMVKQGEQMGSYFGATVLALDITQNGFSDLLVGAPMYSLRAEGGGDEGRLYVYKSNGASLQLQDGNIMGASIVGARFGSAIAHAGDLNMDGYPDIAVGAPYENDHGAVYIYNGGRDGLKTRYAQRIEALKITGAPRGFGMGISDGMDVDDNYYPDLLVGAYDSDQAFLFRTMPLIHTNAWIEIDKDSFSSTAPTCNHRGREFICVTVTPCISYDGKHVPGQIEFLYRLEMDTRRNVSERGFLESPVETPDIIDTKTLQKGKANCFVQKAYIYPDIRDKDDRTPFEFRLSYKLSRPKRQDFCKECVVISKDSQTVITNRTAFKRDCGETNVCIADLILSAKIAGHETGAPLVVGRDNVVTLNINVKNAEDKQAAYLTYVTVDLPENMEIVNLATCELKNNNSTLECDISNPLLAGEEASLSVKLGVSKIKGEVKIKVTATTDSRDSNLANNVEDIALPVIYNGDVGIEGIATVSQYIYNETSETVTVVHSFTVVKYFDTPINRVNLLVSVPTTMLGKKDPFLRLNRIELEDQRKSSARVSGSCNFSSSLKKRSLGRPTGIPRVRRSAEPAPLIGDHIPKAQVKRLKLDCSEAECSSFECQVGPFTDPKKVARMTLELKINISRIMEQVGMPDTVDVVTSASITILDKTTFTHLVKPRPKQTEIITSFVKEGPPTPYQLPWWAYLLIALAGILLLLLIVYCLYKCGFFRRKEKEELEEEKRKSVAVPPSPGNSPSDDSEVRRSLLAVDVADD